MYYIIQENVFRESHYDRIVTTVQRLSLDYEIVRLSGEREDFDFKTNRKDVFCFGAMKLARLARKLDWHPGSLMNDNHDFEVYGSYWNKYMLNSDSKIQTIRDKIDFNHGHLFIRPTLDNKTFTGKVFSKKEWEALIPKLPDHLTIQVARPKTILQEIRCWIVGGKVVTASTYKIGEAVIYREYEDTDGLDFAKNMVDIFQPAKAFVLDICLTANGWHIVEMNCINSAGFYAADLQRLVISLENEFPN